ncbi:hypothetical protein [Corallococcus sp. AB018]|uniref:hypothetical protein n=1 Tax=Corallococcus sp. AB018 TaxID=2316715 RepID=UPI000F88940E|nr:hypothetical protein [Corallococcus sp. AB018]
MSLRRLSLLLVPSCAAWLGCAEAGPPSDEVKGPDVVWSDPREGTATVSDGDLLPGCGEPDAGPVEPDAGVPDTSVLVTADSRFHASTGVTVVPQDLSTRDLELLVPDPSGVGFDRRSGTPVPGGMRFENIPDGEFFVRSNHLYYLTRERRFDLGVNRVGRPDAVYSPVTYTPVTADLSQMDPWQDYESISSPGTLFQVVSGDVDLAASLDFTAWPSAGTTSHQDPDAFLTGFTGYPLPVLDPAKGDRVYVNQLNAVPSGTLPSGAPMAYTTVTSSQHLPSFAFTPDGTTPLSLTSSLQPTPRSEFSMEWRLSEFTRWRADVNPDSTLSLPIFQVLPVPHGLEDGWVGYQGELLNLTLPRGENGVITRRMAFGNPYPASWGVLGYATYTFRAGAPVVVGARGHYPTGSITVVDRLEHFIAGPIVPKISPPREVRIDGLDAYVSRSVGTTQPVVSWRQPVLGTPQAYSVTLTKLTDSSVTPPAKRFYVPGDRTYLRLPPNALEPASTYFLRVTADGSPGFEPWRAPSISMERLPGSSASTFSAAFTTP